MSDLQLVATSDYLRASHISRWGIVQTAVQQNIAEHMYRVWLLVRAFGPTIELGAMDQTLAEEIALMHDLPEIRTGDAPTPHKTPALKAHLAEIEQQILPELHFLTEVASQEVLDLVKFCDTVEAILFLKVNGLGTHACDVCLLLESQMRARLSASSIDPAAAASLLAQFHAIKAST